MTPRRMKQEPGDEAEALRVAVAAGYVVRGACACTSWLLAACDVGEVCGACGMPMRATS